jgi:DNA polymerase-3 subunit gamma/tau
MAYEVTATRKRPQDFDHLLGQEFVVSTLKNALRSERIAHAYLFAGPRGVGKTSAARLLAKALNNPSGPNADSAFDWVGAEDIAKGRSIDVIEIDGASNTSVNDVRAIKDEVLFPPQSSRYKIYIIDEVHMLSNSAFNALLKTIEEPPPYIIFIFATTELHKVPATIRSRCQQFMFRLIPLDVIRNLLADAATDLGVQADDEALYWIAKESTGSMRDAYTLFDQVVSFSEGHIKLERIREKLGLVGLEQINEMASLCLAGDTGGVLNLFHQVLVSGVSVEQFVIDLTEYYRGLLFIQVGIHRESLLGYASERFLKEAVSAYSRPQIEKIISMLLQTYRDIRYSVDARYEFEVTLARMCRMRSFIEPNDLYTKFRQLEQGMRNGAPETMAAAAVVSQPAAVVPPAPFETPVSRETMLAEHWQAIVQSIRKSKPTLSSLLDQVIEWHHEADCLFLTLEGRYAADSLRGDSATVLNACREIVPSTQKLEIKVQEKMAPGALSNPVNNQVEKVREIFHGEIVRQGGQS